MAVASNDFERFIQPIPPSAEYAAAYASIRRDPPNPTP